eukprot:TRINITY_DN92767_c0_g1_i1.p1 TRINITY_DN92767_c0_g1~~TRINITY_DN92767_c0_g1_i1.p1  ORF type:complete len:351 (+),score=42.86 TRINITY_DN92767_c0_g1_i1:90-1142(+)
MKILGYVDLFNAPKAGRLFAQGVQTVALWCALSHTPMVLSESDGYQVVPNVSTLLANGFGEGFLKMAAWAGSLGILLDVALTEYCFVNVSNKYKCEDLKLLVHDVKTLEEFGAERESVIESWKGAYLHWAHVTQWHSLGTWAIGNFGFLGLLYFPLCIRSDPWLTDISCSGTCNEVCSDAMHVYFMYIFYGAALVGAILNFWAINAFNKMFPDEQNWRFDPTSSKEPWPLFSELREEIFQLGYLGGQRSACVGLILQLLAGLTGIMLVMINNTVKGWFQFGRLISLDLEILAIIFMTYSASLRIPIASSATMDAFFPVLSHGSQLLVYLISYVVIVVRHLGSWLQYAPGD